MGDKTLSNGAMDPQKFRSTMTALNHGSVMQAAARNLQKEMLRDAEASARHTEGASRAVIDMQDLEQARARHAAWRRGVAALPLGLCSNALTWRHAGARTRR